MNKNITKLIITFLVGIFFLSACSNNNNGNNTPTPTPAQTQKVLIWWNLFEPVENVEQIIATYEQNNPNVTIQYEEKATVESGGVDAYYAELERIFNDGDPLTTPDILTVHNTWLDHYKNFLVQAPETIFPGSDFQDFYPIVQDDFGSNGIYGAPLYMDAIAIIYNKSKLIEAGYTVPSDDWSEFKTQAINLTKKTSNNNINSAGFSARDVNNSQFSFELFNLLLMQNEVDLAAETLNLSEQQEALDAISFYNTFANGESATWNKDFKLDVAEFLEGDLAMYAAPSWRLIDILEYNQAYGLGLDVGVVPVPQLGGDENIYWATYWGQVVARDSAYPEDSWRFIKYLTEAEQLQQLNQTVLSNGRPLGIIYPRQSMADQVTSDQYLSPYLQSVASAKNWNMVNGYALRQAYKEALKQNNNANLTGLSDAWDSIIDGN